ncbi:hypothetical protein [Aquimarina algiphila]|uniref:Uncharacterized protein n=1 Tax=Aquimarina algiphila TaxID=2047982 RepID=A0A554VK51_9FLAO|nr:hypothetical protein [Aquimarina algiphila]TSE08331.1 hypothetical protein FOF46_13115 [Aquimarina algiphila]
MKYLSIYYQLFNQDLNELNTGFIPKRKYLTFLKQQHPYLFTKYSVQINQKDKDLFSLIRFVETPFYDQEYLTTKNGFAIISPKEVSQDVFAFVLKTLELKSSEISELHVKEEGNIFHFEIIIARCFAKLSEIELCFYYYSVLMWKFLPN